MARGVLTEEVVSLMKSLDFEGTKDELRLMPYLMVKLLDNETLKNISQQERELLFDWKSRGWVLEHSRSSDKFIVTEDFLDRVYKILKVGYCSDVLEYTKHDWHIIFEGCDGSGKTSIMRNLWDDRDLHNYHISDRSFISDKVYASKFGRKEVKGIPTELYVNYNEIKTSKLAGLKYVLCYGDPKILAERCIEKDDPIIKNKSDGQLIAEITQDIDSFCNETREFCSKYGIPLLEVDTTKEDLNTSTKKVKKFL